MEKRVKEVMSKIFNVDVNKVGDDASPDTIEDWDSLHHMNLILALEDEFKVVFSDEQINEMLNFKLILVVLQELFEKRSKC